MIPTEILKIYHQIHAHHSSPREYSKQFSSPQTELAKAVELGEEFHSELNKARKYFIETMFPF